MYKKMLVPLDGSELAEVVFPYAKELAGRLDLDLVFLHVCSPEESELLPMRRLYVEQKAEIVTRQSYEAQEKSGIEPKGKAVEGRGETVIGHPAEEILNYADKKDIDVILMATHGRSGIRRWAMGSVADKVLRASRVPVWLVRAGIPEEVVYDKWPSRTILVPLDGSELAELALPHAEAVAKQRGAELLDVVLLRVCELADMEFTSPAIYHLVPDSYPTTRPVAWEKYVEQETNRCKKANEEYLTGVAKRLEASGLKVRTKVLVGKRPLEGKPADEIVEYTSKNPFNLVVMSTHGRSGLSRWAFGSVAERVLHAVSSPLLLVRPD